MKKTIHKTAIIDGSAKIAENVSIGPWCIIGPSVVIGENTTIESHVVIKKNTKIGKNNYIHPYASIGDNPQHIGYKGEAVFLEIGDNNIIREFCTLNRGSMDGKGTTVIGNNNFFMAYSHVAHDCTVGNHIVFANNASIAGHVIIGDHVILSAFTGIHQFCHVGAFSFLGRACKVVQDIPPYVMVVGNPAGPCGLNTIGLQRNGFSADAIATIKKAYKILYQSGYKLKESYAKLTELAETHEEIRRLTEFLDGSKRGLARPNHL
jgi:UDP-N-acetylglucosamine acyltransferase